MNQYRHAKKFHIISLFFILWLGVALQPVIADAQNPYIGEIKMFAGNFAPRGWALCDGQLLPVAQNTALFSILGTSYGGDGEVEFGLPDLRGRHAMHGGTGSALTPRVSGEKGGSESVVLNQAQLPSHEHGVTVNLPVNSGTGDSATPVDTYLAKTIDQSRQDYSTTTDDSTLAADGVEVNLAPSGGSQAHNNMAPYLVINYIIALEGLYP